MIGVTIGSIIENVTHPLRLSAVSWNCCAMSLDIAQQPSHNSQPKGRVKYVNTLSEDGVVA